MMMVMMVYGQNGKRQVVLSCIQLTAAFDAQLAKRLYTQDDL